MTKGPLLSIIVPVFNEKITIAKVIARIIEVPLEKEIIVIDDCSTDGTYEILMDVERSNPGIRLLRHESNYGKGRSVRDGFKEARGDIAVIQDADLEYDPKEIPKLVQPITEGYADVVYGSRFVGHPRRALFFWHSVGNRLLTTFSNLFSNLNITDMETCYKAFKKIVYKNLKLVSDRFDIEPEITAKIARMRFRIYEIPISYKGRAYWEGKKISWADALKAMIAIVKHSLFTKISDDIGFQTLELMSDSSAYNKMIYKRIAPFIGNRILEVGSGIGSITKFLYSKDFVMATDISDSYLHILENTFSDSPNIRVENLKIEELDVTRTKGCGFDTVVCLNVLEHIEDDRSAVGKIHEVLPDNGRLILLVPSHALAYGTLDRHLGHHRRYSKKDISDIAAEAGFDIVKMDHFNSIGFIGWLIASRILRRKKLSRLQMKLFNFTLPFLALEKLVGPPFGLSIIAVLEKKRA